MRAGSKVTVEGTRRLRGKGHRPIEFVTAEHYMMYHKARLMGDTEAAEQIRTAPHPSEAKALGRRVRGFDRERWNAEADRVVEEGNWLKFSQHEHLRDVLLATGDKVLVEARYAVSRILYIFGLFLRSPPPSPPSFPSLSSTPRRKWARKGAEEWRKRGGEGETNGR